VIAVRRTESTITKLCPGRFLWRRRWNVQAKCNWLVAWDQLPARNGHLFVPSSRLAPDTLGLLLNGYGGTVAGYWLLTSIYSMVTYVPCITNRWILCNVREIWYTRTGPSRPLVGERFQFSDSVGTRWPSAKCLPVSSNRIPPPPPWMHNGII
jgi:hypothetical protein